VTSVSDGGDEGRPVMVQSGKEGEEVRSTMMSVGERVWKYLAGRERESTGQRG
jgi:ATP-binding protein involved in chromosome partitioning